MLFITVVPLQRVLCNTLKLKVLLRRVRGKNRTCPVLFLLDLAKRAELIGEAVSAIGW